MPGIAYLLISFTVLLVGYKIYGRIVEKAFGPDERVTPAVVMRDDVDYAPLPSREIMVTQFLSISGAGPIFGAILGVLYGPAALLWIVFGAIFAGGVHDYLSGMIAMRYRGESIPDVVGYILGSGFKQFIRLFSIILLLLVGVVFVLAPADLMAGLTRVENDTTFWVVVIFLYYFAATILPIEVLINRLNPLFTLALTVMTIGILVALFFNDHQFYKWNGFANAHPHNLSLWPLMFITIACGAISGFHATQTSIAARCVVREKLGRKIFYGSMLMEACIALIWATAGMTIYQSSEALQAALANGGPSVVVSTIAMDLLGEIGGTLAIVGVVILPVTSGDTAFRSSRLIVADCLGLAQKSIASRLLIAMPIFAVGIALSMVDFDVIWRYFAWSNQTLACIVLWAGAAYLVRRGTGYWIAAIPATFMTGVVATYIYYVDIGFHLPYNYAVSAGLATAVLALAVFLLFRPHFRNHVPLELPMAGRTLSDSQD